jgi:hypothetical protein
MVQILRFRPAAPRVCDWTQSELAEFYRVERALIQAGLSLESERGLSDEGDPWFAFCRCDSGEVFVHFARLSGEYIIDGTGLQGVARGYDFKALVQRLISGEAFQLAKLRPANSNVFLHPAALLIALVGAAFFHSGDAKAAENAAHRPEGLRSGGLTILVRERTADALAAPALDAAQAAVVIAGVLIGMDETQTLPGLPAPAAPAPAASGQAFDLTPPPATGDSAPARHMPAAPIDAQTDAAGPAPEWRHAATVVSADLLPLNVNETDLAKLAGLMLPPPADVSLTALTGGAAGSPAVGQAHFLASAVNTLPADEAGDILRALASPSDPHPVSLADNLPALMADLIRHGSQVPGTAAATPKPTPAVGGAPGPQGGATAATAAAGDLPHHHDPVIDQDVAAFMAVVSHWSVVASGEDLVVYDTDIFGAHASGALESVTFKFSDGSSISLVGTVAELTNAHILH